MAFLVLFILKNRRLHSTANWFVLSLVVADFGVGVGYFPWDIFVAAVCNKSVYVTFMIGFSFTLPLQTWAF